MKPGKLVLWIPAVLMIAVTAVFAVYAIASHYTEVNGFWQACRLILVMLSPLIVYLVANRLRATNSTKHFGGLFSTFICTVICTAVVVIVSSIATAYRELAFQVEPWEIYTYYVVVSISEETYYRLVLCWGILALLSCKHLAIGIAGAAFTTILGFIGGAQTSTDARAAWIGASILVFAAFYIVAGRKYKEAPAWAIIVAVSISAVSFSLAHWNVYQAYPEMLLATLIGGATMAAFLVATRNPFVPFMAHFVNNLVSLRGVIIN